MKEQRFMNPYLAGVLLGLVLLGAMYLSGRGLGASGALKSVVMQTVSAISPERFEALPYYAHQAKAQAEGSLLKNWLVLEVAGVVIGAIFSAIASGRMALRLEKGPNISSRTRLLAAAAGGMLFGIGSQLGRGCTSGSALSGMAVMSAGGILTMLFIFGAGYGFAYVFRKLWL